MMRSLYAGVAGLRTHQTKMDVIGNNIANVNTTAYKAQSVTFSDLMYQTTRRASGASADMGVGGTNASQIGLGVKVGAINSNVALPGATQTTNYGFDIAISGDSFFVVNNGQENLFTRAGSFYIDGDGNLAMTSTGYLVQGWQPDPQTGNIVQNTVTPLKVMDEAFMTYDPEATSQATVTGLIDKNSTDINSSAGKIMNLEFYDNLGYKYSAKFSVHAADGDMGEYYVKLDDITDPEGNSIGAAMGQVGFGSPNLSIDTNVIYKSVSGVAPTLNDPNNDGDFTDATQVTLEDVSKNQQTFDIGTYTVNADGSLTDPGGNTIAVADVAKFTNIFPIDMDDISEFTIEANGNLTVTKMSVENAARLNFDPATGQFEDIFGNGAGLVSLTFDQTGTAFVGNFQDVELDFSATRTGDYNKKSTINADPGSRDANGFVTGEGRAIGDLLEIIVQDDGMIYANYSNGQRRLMGQIAVANFANPSGLEKRGENVYAASMNSGGFDGVGSNVKEGGGSMQTGVLEMSNVDLSAEFTEMITTQRGFQANSRIITVSDTLLEELTNLKR